MKIKGKSFDKPKPVTVILPFGDEDILILCGCIPDYGPFEEMCPPPVAPKVLRPGKIESVNVQDKTFLKQVGEHAQLRTYWLIKESVKETEGLEWEKVVDNDPSTWHNLEREMTVAFGELGVSKIIKAVLRANGLSQEIVGEARDSFLASQLLQSVE